MVHFAAVSHLEYSLAKSNCVSSGGNGGQTTVAFVFALTKLEKSNIFR